MATTQDSNLIRLRIQRSAHSIAKAASIVEDQMFSARGVHVEFVAQKVGEIARVSIYLNHSQVEYENDRRYENALSAVRELVIDAIDLLVKDVPSVSLQKVSVSPRSVRESEVQLELALPD